MQSLGYNKQVGVLFDEAQPAAEWGDAAAVHKYFDHLLDLFRTRPARIDAVTGATRPRELAEQVFQILTNRKFCYLSKKKVAPYKADVLHRLLKNIHAGEPLDFYLDIGGGYHASLYPQRLPPKTQPGLGELLILAQIKQFADKIASIYRHGIRFHLVIDNYSALFINDIREEETNRFCEQLRELIRSTGMDAMVDILLESDACPAQEYRAVLEDFTPASLDITDEEVANVERFIGRKCSRQEAARRKALYAAVIEVSERCLGRVIDGVHMTQRATPGNLCFRAYPGADSRIQCGEVALCAKQAGAFSPLLLTSKNIDNYLTKTLDLDIPVPKAISRVMVAQPI